MEIDASGHAHSVWIVSRDRRVYCKSTVPYSDSVVKAMKKAGYRVKEISANGDGKTGGNL